MRTEVSRHINAPADRVWAIITDLAGVPDVLSGVTAVEVLEGPDPLDVGTRWRETRTMFGREATEEIWVVALDPGRSYRTAAQSHGARYESTLEVRPHEDESAVLTMTFSGEPTSLVSRVLAATVGRLFAGATRKALEQDLADIAAAAEPGPTEESAQDSGGRPTGP